MANKESLKIPVSRDRFMEALKYRKTSIFKLGEVPEIERTEKTIRRCLKQGTMAPDLLDRIGKYLDVHPDFLSGKYDESISYAKMRRIKSRLSVENFPYFIKKQEQLKYKNYFRDILLMHDISMEQFLALEEKHRIHLQLEIERAINTVIYKYFKCDARGREDMPELRLLETQIDSAVADIFSVSDVEI